MVSPTDNSTSSFFDWPEIFSFDLGKSKLAEVAEIVSDFFNNVTKNNSSEKTLIPEDSASTLPLNNSLEEMATPFEMPVKNIFKKALLSIPTFPQHIASPQTALTNPTSAICVILALTALQHLAINYCDQRNTERKPTPTSIYTRISNHASIGSLAGTFTSWTFNQNLYTGALIGSSTSVVLGLGLDYLQTQIGDPTIRVLEKAAGKLYYGGRTFLEGTIAALIGPLAFKALPSVSEDPSIDLPVRFALSSLCSLMVLSHLESAYPSDTSPPGGKKTKEHSSSLIISVPRYSLQTIAVSSLISHFFAWTSGDTL